MGVHVDDVHTSPGAHSLLCAHGRSSPKMRQPLAVLMVSPTTPVQTMTVETMTRVRTK